MHIYKKTRKPGGGKNNHGPKGKKNEGRDKKTPGPSHTFSTNCTNDDTLIQEE